MRRLLRPVLLCLILVLPAVLGARGGDAGPGPDALLLPVRSTNGPVKLGRAYWENLRQEELHQSELAFQDIEARRRQIEASLDSYVAAGLSAAPSSGPQDQAVRAKPLNSQPGSGQWQMSLALALLLLGFVAARKAQIFGFFDEDPGWRTPLESVEVEAATALEKPGQEMEATSGNLGQTEPSSLPDVAVNGDGKKDAEPITRSARLANEFNAGVRTQVAGLEELIRELDQEGREKAFWHLCDRVQVLTRKATEAEARLMIQVSGALEQLLREAMLRELGELQVRLEPGTLETVRRAVTLLGELCDAERRAQLGAGWAQRVLLVDGDVTLRESVVGALQGIFDKPDTAADAAEALALLERQAYDAIILESALAGRDGRTLRAEIQATALNGQTPVLLMGADEGVRQEMLAGGEIDFIAKPFLSAEIPVRALILALQKRLRSLVGTSTSAEKEESPVNAQRGRTRRGRRKRKQVEARARAGGNG